MLPAREHIKELQERFGVYNGQFWGVYRFKNLNWYLGKMAGDVFEPFESFKWFCYGDVRDEDVPRLQDILEDDEVLFLGWKELGPNEFWDEVFRDGEGPWMVITKKKVPFDARRDMHVSCKNPECPKAGRCRGRCALYF